jgi:hypothetical protein
MNSRRCICFPENMFGGNSPTDYHFAIEAIEKCHRAAVYGTRLTSEMGQKATVWPRTDDFRSTPINRHRYRPSACLECAITGRAQPRQVWALFDHLVGAGEQHVWHRKTECLCSP